MKKLLFASLLVLSACSTVTVRNSDKMPPIHPTDVTWNKFFIGGIGQEKIIEADSVCHGRGYTVKSYYSFIDGLFAAVTFGIYTPSTTEIYCERVK